MANNEVKQSLRTLVTEEPRSLIAKIRAIAPEIEAALEVGHTLTLIHQRLNAAGLQISYDALRIYRKRIQREKRPVRPAIISEMISSLDSNQSASETAARKFDPSDNYRKQIAKRPIYEYPSGPVDEEKLF